MERSSSIPTPGPVTKFANSELSWSSRSFVKEQGVSEVRSCINFTFSVEEHQGMPGAKGRRVLTNDID